MRLNAIETMRVDEFDEEAFLDEVSEKAARFLAEEKIPFGKLINDRDSFRDHQVAKLASKMKPGLKAFAVSTDAKELISHANKNPEKAAEVLARYFATLQKREVAA